MDNAADSTSAGETGRAAAAAGREPAPLPRRGPWAPILQFYPALTRPDFRWLWAGTLPSNLAWSMSTVAVGYAAYTISGSATALGWVSLAMALPMLVLPLVGGVVADRLPRRAVLVTSQMVFGLESVLIAALALTGHLAVWHLVAFALIQGSVVSFNMPARQALIAELVGPRLLRNAIALNNAGLNTCRIAGPSLAGVLLAWPQFGIGGVFATMAALYVLVLGTLLRLPAHAPAAKAIRAPGQGGWAALIEGLEYVRASPVLLALLGLALVPLFFGMPYQALMPVFAEQVFAVGATGLGMLMAAAGVGSLGGALTIAILSNHPRPAYLQLGFGLGFGLALIGFALAPSFLFALPCLLAVGFCSAAYTALNNTLIMSNTEPRLHGRIMSVYLLTFAVFPLGSVPAAWLADHIGGRLTIAGGGLIVALTLIGVAVLYPPYRRIQ